MVIPPVDKHTRTYLLVSATRVKVLKVNVEPDSHLGHFGDHMVTGAFWTSRVGCGKLANSDAPFYSGLWIPDIAFSLIAFLLADKYVLDRYRLCTCDFKANKHDPRPLNDVVFSPTCYNNQKPATVKEKKAQSVVVVIETIKLPPKP